MVYIDNHFKLISAQFVSVVSHDSASKECRRKMGEAYALNQKSKGIVSEEDLNNLRRKLDEDEDEDQEQEAKPRRQRQKLI